MTLLSVRCAIVWLQGWAYLHARHNNWFLANCSEVLSDLALAELDVVDNSVVGEVQTTQHPVGSKNIHAGTDLEVLKHLSERLEMRH
jgi:hypothetical protein